MRREKRFKGLFEIEYKNEEIVDELAKIYVGYSPYSDIMYIVQTKELLEVRNKDHLVRLRRGEHSCKVFQKLYEYVGEETIKFKIVDKCFPKIRKI